MKRKEGAFAVAQVAIVVGVLTLISLPVFSSTPGGYASTVGSNGLQLSMSVNATQITVGQSLQVNVSLFNTLPKVNDVPTSDDWPFQGIPVALWPPCYYAYDPGNAVRFYPNSTTVAQAVVLKGDYTMANISTVANVRFHPACMEDVTVDHAIFQPRSSQVNLTGIYDVSSGNSTLGPFQLSTGFNTNGYWDLLNNSYKMNPPIINNQTPPLPPTATPFVPGVYTVAVADEWGQAVLLHFVVN
jgi:hypothetical protein